MVKNAFSASDLDLTSRAEQAIAHGALTNSKRPSCFVKGVYPTHLTRGRGCYVWDSRGNKYIDFICGLGSNLLGYANEEVNQAISERLKNGASLSLSSSLEVEVAEKVKEMFPFIERLRFLKTGSDACSAAIVIARSFHNVRNENEKMYGLLGNKDFTSVPQGQIETGWFSDALQGLCEEISIRSQGHGNQETGSGKICEDPSGDICREATFSNTSAEDKGSKKRQGLLSGASEFIKRALFSLWMSAFSGSSFRLLEASGCYVALRGPSRFRTSPRVLVLSDGYHGHHSDFVGLTPPHCGVVKDPYILPLTGNEDLIPIAAACIIEPVLTDYSPTRKVVVQKIAKRCQETGTLLIFDEVITGLRTPGHSVAAGFDVIPDLICLGKALGNGMPVSVVGGRREVMESDYFVSSTFAGETLSLASALKTMQLMQQKFKVETLWDKGTVFLREFNSLWKDGVWIEGYPTRGAFRGNPDSIALFWQEACRSGLLFGPSWFFCFPHIDVMDQVLSTCKNILGRVRRGEVRLEGEMPQKPYAQQIREAGK